MITAAMLSAENVFYGGRGPEQIVAGREREREGKSSGPPISEASRAVLKELMKEGFGDHILLLRLYQVW